MIGQGTLPPVAERQVAWIDEILFPEGFAAALTSENAAPVNASVFDFLLRRLSVTAPSFPRQDTQGSRREPKALALTVVGDMVS